MKTKVIIENGEIEIILTPENEFEIDIIEKIYKKKENYSIKTNFNAKNASGSYPNYGTYSNHKIELLIKENE